MRERERERGGGTERVTPHKLLSSIHTSYIFRMPLALDTQRRAQAGAESEGGGGLFFVSLIREQDGCGGGCSFWPIVRDLRAAPIERDNGDNSSSSSGQWRGQGGAARLKDTHILAS